MSKEGNWEKNNTWTSATTSSLNSCEGCNCGKKEKNTKNGDSGCGCK